MIATILPGSENFHAVGYNERKVSKGTAHLLEMRNFGAVGVIQPDTPNEKVRFLQRYSFRNDRVRKAQFHVAISCKGQEMTEAQLLDFTHQYLQEMGYAEPGQPWLIYAHHDTDNLHLHVITSRVAPDGHKINHHHERRRSQVVIDKLMGINREKQTQKDIKAAKQYHFSSFAQFKMPPTATCWWTMPTNESFTVPGFFQPKNYWTSLHPLNASSASNASSTTS